MNIIQCFPLVVMHVLVAGEPSSFQSLVPHHKLHKTALGSVAGDPTNNLPDFDSLQ